MFALLPVVRAAARRAGADRPSDTRRGAQGRHGRCSATSSGSPPCRRRPTPRTSTGCWTPTSRWPAGRSSAMAASSRSSSATPWSGVFGVPATHEDDARARRPGGPRDLRGRGSLPAPRAPLRLRVGINTGEALARLDVAPGSGERFLVGDADQHRGADPVGRARSWASRSGAATWEATRPPFDYEELPPADPQGQGRAGPRLPRARRAPRVGDVRA